MFKNNEISSIEDDKEKELLEDADDILSNLQSNFNSEAELKTSLLTKIMMNLKQKIQLI